MASEQRSRLGLQRERKDPGLVYAEQIPSVLFNYSQWVCWRYFDQGEGKKPDKQPVNPRTLANAGVHWANTWTSFEQAYATYLRHCHRTIHGIGFVLTPSDPYVAVDLDACIHEEGLEDTAAQVIAELGSYTEVSPSGYGLRILLACPEFHDNARRVNIEVYSHSRYVTVTGHHVADTPPTISIVSPDVISTLLPPVLEHDFSPQKYTSGQEQYAISDMELWDRIFAHDKYGEQHLKRFQGDFSFDRGDHSFTVIRLLNCLARWTHCDPGRMRSMMLLSPLANDKWFKKRGAGDWLDHQIANAIAYVSGKR